MTGVQTCALPISQFDPVELADDALQCIGLSSNFDDSQTEVVEPLCKHKEIRKSKSFSLVSIRKLCNQITHYYNTISNMSILLHIYYIDHCFADRINSKNPGHHFCWTLSRPLFDLRPAESDGRCAISDPDLAAAVGSARGGGTGAGPECQRRGRRRRSRRP